MLKIAIAGRPNVGKSTLFNLLAGRKKAIVANIAGTTVDINFTKGQIGPFEFELLDTAGLEQMNNQKNDLSKRIAEHTIKAVKNVDLILFVIDGRAGVLADDYFIADILRQNNSSVIVLVNKSESDKSIEDKDKIYKLGFD